MGIFDSLISAAKTTLLGVDTSNKIDPALQARLDAKKNTPAPVVKTIPVPAPTVTIRPKVDVFAGILQSKSQPVVNKFPVVESTIKPTVAPIVPRQAEDVKFKTDLAKTKFGEYMKLESAFLKKFAQDTKLLVTNPRVVFNEVKANPDEFKSKITSMALAGTMPIEDLGAQAIRAIESKLGRAASEIEKKQVKDYLIKLSEQGKKMVGITKEGPIFKDLLATVEKENPLSIPSPTPPSAVTPQPKVPTQFFTGSNGKVTPANLDLAGKKIITLQGDQRFLTGAKTYPEADQKLLDQYSKDYDIIKIEHPEMPQKAAEYFNTKEAKWYSPDKATAESYAMQSRGAKYDQGISKPPTPELKANEQFVADPVKTVEELRTQPATVQENVVDKMLKSEDVAPAVKETIKENFIHPAETPVKKQKMISIAEKNNIRSVVKAISERSTELSLLKQRIQDRSKMDKLLSERNKTIADIKLNIKDDKKVRQILVNYLKSKISSRAEQGEFIPLIRDVKSTEGEAKLIEAMDKIDIKATAMNEEAVYNKNISRTKSTIAFVKKLGDIGSVSISKELKAEAGITDWAKATPEQLQKVLKGLKERLQYKLEHGFEIEGEKRFPNEPTREMVDKFRGQGKVKPPLLKTPKEAMKSLGEWFHEIGGVLSSELYDIAPSLRNAMVKMEFDTRQLQKQWAEEAKDYQNKLLEIKKASPEDYNELWMALYHGQMETVNRINAQYGAKEAHTKFRKMMDDIYATDTKAGAKFGYRENLFPRVVEDSKGLLDHIYGQDEAKTIIDKAVKEFEMNMARPSTPMERDKITNMLLRGFPQGKVGLSQAGGTKERMIDVLTPEMMNFYLPPEASLEVYIKELAEDVAKRNMFGKSESGDIEDSIGHFVNKLVDEGNITNEQAIKLRDLLAARFNSGSPNKFFQFTKNLAYIETLGNFLNAVTQLKDIALSAYRNGILGTVKNVGKAAFNQSDIKLIDLGLDQMSSEFQQEGGLKKTLSKVFSYSFMETMDRIGKEAYINSAVENIRKQVENPDKMNKFLERLRGSFNEEELMQVVLDLKSGKITENIKYLAFSELAKVQPITLSEMPQKYLEMRNGKLFYMLKSYSLKQLDIVRQDVNNVWRTDKVKAATNLIKMMAFLALWGATIDEIKDYIKGKKVDFSDHVVDNMLQTFFLSKYAQTTLSKDGFSGFAKNLLVPPTKTVDTIFKAIFAPDGKKLQTFGDNIVRSIPLVGEEYYWWFGKGSKPPTISGGSSKSLKRPGAGGTTGKASLKRPGTTVSKTSLKRPAK